MGKFSAAVGATSCTNCAAGKYQPDATTSPHWVGTLFSAQDSYGDTSYNCAGNSVVTGITSTQATYGMSGMQFSFTCTEITTTGSLTGSTSTVSVLTSTSSRVATAKTCPENYAATGLQRYNWNFHLICQPFYSGGALFVAADAEESNNALSAQTSVCVNGFMTGILGSIYAAGGGSFVQLIAAQAVCSPFHFTTSCSSCAAGEYQSMSGSGSCTPCLAGSYQASSGSTSCTACSGGQYSKYGMTSCSSSCPPGFYETVGRSSCTPCAAGNFQQSSGSSSCIPCPAGFYSDSGSPDCTACAAGTFSSSVGASACASCTRGTYQAVAASDSCVPCVAVSNGSQQQVHEAT